MHDHQPIIDRLRTFAHRTDVERVDEAVQAFRPIGDETVLELADALADEDDYLRVMALEVLYEWNGDSQPVLPAVIRALEDRKSVV